MLLKPHMPNFGIMFVFRAILKMITLYYLVFHYLNIKLYEVFLFVSPEHQ